MWCDLQWQRGRGVYSLGGRVRWSRPKNFIWSGPRCGQRNGKAEFKRPQSYDGQMMGSMAKWMRRLAGHEAIECGWGELELHTDQVSQGGLAGAAAGTVVGFQVSAGGRNCVPTAITTLRDLFSARLKGNSKHGLSTA